jgi:hypothetical protein
MQNKFKPVSTYAIQQGIKCVIYGPPGEGKTPLITTAPRPALFFAEAGILTLRKSDIPAWDITTREAIDDMIKWLFTSNEVKNYDTFAFDSVSQMAEIVLASEIKKNKDGRKAFGEMSRVMMDFFNGIYFSKNKHYVLLAKQGVFNEGGVNVVKPYFPGQDLNIKVPHLFDEVFHLAKTFVPGVGNVPALRTIKPISGEIMARDRSGTLAELEPANLTHIFNKIQTGLSI